jgi:hypothetical protein
MYSKRRNYRDVFYYFSACAEMRDIPIAKCCYFLPARKHLYKRAAGLIYNMMRGQYIDAFFTDIMYRINGSCFSVVIDKYN